MSLILDKDYQHLKRMFIVSRSSLSAVMISFYVFCLGALPPLVSKVFHTSSLGAGIVIYCFLLLLCLKIKYTDLFLFNKKLFFSGFLVFFYSLVQMSFMGLFEYKSYFTIPFLLFFFIVSYLISINFKKINRCNFKCSIFILSLVLFIVAVTNIFIDLRFSGYTHAKAVVPFSEPSHFALFSGMFFVFSFVLAANRKARFFIFVSVVLLSVGFPNTTMLMYAILMALLLLRFRISSLLVSVSILVILVLIISNTPYFSQRMTISRASANLSALVYLQGVYDAYEAIVSTHALGLGFQMLGTQPPSEIAELISLRLGGEGELNRQDGGFLGAKIIAEFGVLGIISVLLFVVLSFRSFLFLRMIIHKRLIVYDPVVVFIHCVFYSFSVEIFIRGYGYFSPGVFIFLASVACLAKYKSDFSYKDIGSR